MTAAQPWRNDIRSWGRVERVRHRVSRPASAAAALLSVTTDDPEKVLTHGCGRSYGDAALNPSGRLIMGRGLDRFVTFDRATGVLTAEAGVRLADILATLSKPDSDGSGWFLPVTPGTRFVTLGGAIANDVHGKNHHRAGTFGRHVLSFLLARSDGRQLLCSPTQNSELFAATIGGLGLTGLILQATIQLKRVSGTAFEAEDIRFDNLDELFALAAESDADWEYTAAWVDCLASGDSFGRGIFSRARHAPGHGAAPPPRDPSFGLPGFVPVSAVRPGSVRAFNALYWRKLGPGRTRKSQTGGYGGVLYPLDALDRWNHLYGPRGFFQFQSVFPMRDARAVLEQMLRTIAASGEGSMLTVVKVCGDLSSPGLLSFPMPGVSLALDFPNRGNSTRALLSRLEAMTVAAGGRIYPAKDGVMTPESFRAGYPNFERFRAFIDPAFSSSLAVRVGLVAPSISADESTLNMPDTSPVVAIFGASSGIATAVSRLYAERGARLVLVGRRADALEAAAADLRIRGAKHVATTVADLAAMDGLAAVADDVWGAFGALDVALIAYGAGADQTVAQTDGTVAERLLNVNFTSPAMLSDRLAERFASRRAGTIAVISSVAGDRGRQSNYLYGAAKGGMQRYLQGLRHRLAKVGVTVLDIRPGFVSTEMTAHLDRSGPLWATPERVARDIVGAIDRKRSTIYTPWFWRYIMLGVRNAPEFLFHRTKL